jgi:uncharacterized protein YdaU (DUF1376 family)
MPLYIADYLADTTHLDCAESGAYLHLIMHYWQRGFLPDDDKKLSCIAKAQQKHWIKMRPILVQFFHDGWKHKRIDDELKKASETSERRSESANKRWSKSNANAYANEDAKHMHRAGVLQSQSHKESFNGGGKKESVANGQHTSMAPNSSVYVMSDTPQGDAWNDHSRKTKGKSQVWDKKGGWSFPTEWPPQ